MELSEGIKNLLDKYSVTEEEEIEHQKLIDAGIIGSNKHSNFDISDWESKVKEHGGDRNWATIHDVQAVQRKMMENF